MPTPNSLKQLLLTLAYDGTNYFGYQKTAHGPSIEESLEKALVTLLKEPIFLRAASRTDKGVHAKEAKVSFFTHTSLTLASIKKSLNGLLPKDISIVEIEEKSLLFHPTLDAKKKIYRYYFSNASVLLPHHRLYAWHYRYEIDFEKIEKAIPYLIGIKDFSTFTHENYKDPTCSLSRISINKESPFLSFFEIEGNRFLYNMVRILVGTLLYIGSGKIPLEDLPKIIESKERKKAGITAPPEGLFLEKVFYC